MRLELPHLAVEKVAVAGERQAKQVGHAGVATQPLALRLRASYEVSKEDAKERLHLLRGLSPAQHAVEALPQHGKPDPHRATGVDETRWRNGLEL